MIGYINLKQLPKTSLLDIQKVVYITTAAMTNKNNNNNEVYQASCQIHSVLIHYETVRLLANKNS